MSIENGQQIENQSTQNESKDIFDIQKIKEKYGYLNEGFDVFENYLKGLNEEEKIQILEKFNGKYDDILLSDIAINGFPNNQNINEFKSKFGINNFKEDTVEKKEEAKKLYLERYNELKDIKTSNKDFNNLLLGFEKLQNGEINVSDITEYINLLIKENKFNDILKVIKEHDNNNGTDYFSSFENTLISIDSSFEEKINIFQNSNPELFRGTLEGERNVAIQDVNNIDYGDGVKSLTDFKKRPPERFLSNGDYRLETPLGVRDFYEATVKYERGKAELDKGRKEVLDKGNKKNAVLKEKEQSIKDLEEINWGGEDEYLNELKEDDEYLNQLKEEVKQIKTELEILKDEYYTFDKKYEDLEAQYRLDLANEVENYRNTIREQDKESLETLDFIHSIGFDAVPQNDTDKLIAQMNAGIDINRAEIDLGAGFSLNTDIDLSRGILGFSDGIDGTSTKEKEVFIRFFNKMLTGDPTKPINPIEAVTNSNFQVNDTLIQDYRAKLYKGGVFNINTALNNLKTKQEV